MDKYIKYAIIALVILGAFKYAGNMDREEHAIASMSHSEYNEIKDSLQVANNSTPSESQIAKEWYKKKGE